MPYLIFPPLFLNSEYLFFLPSATLTTRTLMLGITLAVYPFGQFIGSPILGTLSDSLGRKKLLSLSLMVTALSNILTGYAIAKQNLLGLIVSRFITGCMEGNISIARAMCTDLNLISRHKTLGRINAVTSFGYLVGPFLGGLMTNKNIFQTFTISTPFYFIAFLFFILALLSILILKDVAPTKFLSSKEFWRRFNFIKRMYVLFSNQNLKTLLITSTCFTLATDIFYEFGPIYLTLKWALHPSQLILYNGLLCVGLIIGSGFLSNFISSKNLNHLTINLATIGFVMALSAMVFTKSYFFMYVWFLFSGIFIGVTTTLLTVDISHCVSSKTQGEVMGSQLSLRVLGDAIICLLGGILTIMSPKIIILMASLISCFTFIFYHIKSRKLEIT